MHPVGKSCMNCLHESYTSTRFCDGLARFNEFSSHPRHEVFRVKCPKPSEQFLIAQATLRHRWDFE